MKLHLVTAVWGEAYAKIFGELLLKTLVASGNLPAIQGKAKTHYRIYTNKATAALLEAGPTWSELNALVNVEMVLYDIDYRDHIASHHEIWAHAIGHARTTKAALIFIAPDTMWANGSVSRIVDLFISGYAAIFFPGFRVSNDTFYGAMMREFPESERAPIELSPKELMQRAVQHMHPLKTVFLRHSKMFPHHMENLLWPVGDEGYVLRQYITHSLFAMDPSRIAVNKFSVSTRLDEADRIYWVSGSEEVLFVSLGPMGRDMHWYDHGGRVVANHVAVKSLEFDSAIVSPLIRRRFRFQTSSNDEARWRAVERASDLFTHRVRVAREAIRIWRVLDRAGCTSACQLLLIALFARSLSHAVTFDGPVTVFCPINRELPTIGSPGWHELIDGSALSLRRIVLFHVVRGRYDLAALLQLPRGSKLPGSDLVVDRSESAGLLLNGIPIVRSDVPCAEHSIHLLAAPLFRR